MPNELTNLSQTMQGLRQSRSRTRQTIEDAQKTSSMLEHVFSSEVQTSSQEIQGAVQKQIGIIDKLVQHDTGVMGIFQGTGGLLDAISTAKRRGLESEFRKAGIEGQLAEKKLANVTAKYERAQERINKRVSQEEKLLEFDEKGLVNETKLVELGISLEHLGLKKQEALRKQEVQAVEDADQGTLLEWLRDPSKAPKGLQNKPGLISMALNDKLSKDLATKLQATNLQAAQKSSALNSLELDQLEQVMSGGSPLPSGLARGDIEQEHRRRSEAEMGLQSARLAYQSGQFEFGNQVKTDLLTNRLSVSDLQEALTQAEENGGVLDSNGVQFTANELQVALQNKQLADTERTNKLTQDLITQSGLGAVEMAAVSQGMNLQSVYSPGLPVNKEEPFAALPAPLQVEASRLQLELEAAQAVGNVPIAAEKAAGLQALMEGAKEKAIEAAPKEAKEGYREFIEKGRIDNSGNAAGVLFTTGTNPQALAYNEVLDPVWKAFVGELNTLRDEASLEFSVDAGGGLTIPTGKKSVPGVLVEQAVKDSRARELFAVVGRQAHLADTIKQLIAEEPGETASIWAEVYNPQTGNFNSYVLEQKETDTGVTEAFSLAKLSELLALRSVALQRDGKLPEGVSLGDILYEHAMGNLHSVRNYFGRDISSASLNTALFGNQPENAIVEGLGLLRANQPVAIREAKHLRDKLETQEQVRQLEDEIGQIPANLSTSEIPAAAAREVGVGVRRPGANESLLERYLGFKR